MYVRQIVHVQETTALQFVARPVRQQKLVAEEAIWLGKAVSCQT